MFQTSNFRPEHSNPDIIGNGMREHLQGASFQQVVNQARFDDYARARLTIALLSHVSLDPHAGTSLEDFVDMRPSEDGMVVVYLGFYQVLNFISSFTISRSSSEWLELQDAIRQNLASRLFKAASMHVRMYKALNSRVRVLEKRASAVHQKALDEALALRNPHSPTHWVRPSDEVLHECYAIARSARQTVFMPPRKRLERRMEAVRVQAYDPDYRGSFYEIQTAFAAKYMAPQSRALSAALQ